METTELATQDERAELAAQMEQERRVDPHGMNLQEWYLAQEGRDDAMEALIKKQADRMLAAINARRRAREWRWGREFRARVEEDLAEQKGRKKSVNYITGTAGFRKVQGKVHIVDAAKLKDWAVANLPDALSLDLHVTPIKKYIEDSGDIPPGAEWTPPADRFYPASSAPQLGTAESSETEPSQSEGHAQGTDQ